MLSCQEIAEDNFPGCDLVMDEDAMLRHIAPYNKQEDLLRMLNPEDDLLPFQHGKTRPEDLYRVLVENENADHPSAIADSKRQTSRIVCGTELNEAPAKYEVKGILPHELLVIGLYVDKSICPGFRYKVRYNGRDEELYNGEAKTLLSIGMGYGKRLTFEGDSLNFNDNFFWSDSDPEGFAFSLEVVSQGDVFIIYNLQSEPVGKVTVESLVGHQEETNQETKNGAVCKTVRVMMTCSIDYYQRHQLLDLHSRDLETVEGEVIVQKERREKKAKVLCIKNVNFCRLGQCTLQVDQ